MSISQCYWCIINMLCVLRINFRWWQSVQLRCINYGCIIRNVITLILINFQRRRQVYRQSRALCAFTLSWACFINVPPGWESHLITTFSIFFNRVFHRRTLRWIIVAARIFSYKATWILVTAHNAARGILMPSENFIDEPLPYVFEFTIHSSIGNIYFFIDSFPAFWDK